MAAEVFVPPLEAADARVAFIGCATTHMIIKLFPCGDAMTTRGIDQVLPHPVGLGLAETRAGSAADDVRLAERGHGAYRPLRLKMYATTSSASEREI